jgi:thiamine phosphate synthase YjbQ (UPF0047 family)
MPLTLLKRLIRPRRNRGSRKVLLRFCAGSTGTITTIEHESGVVKDLRAILERIVPSNVP